MHTVLLTQSFERQAQRSGLSEEDIVSMAAAIAADPLGGVLIPGSGGARKLRHAGQGFGKSGGYRTIHYFGGEDVPVFLLALVDKGQRADLNAAERNELATVLGNIVKAYRNRGR